MQIKQNLEKENHLEFIDALRGYAIFGVMASHVSQLTPQWSGFIRKIVDQGQCGVQLFFLISALSLLISWNSRKESALKFYVRRLFRILPMFWLGIIFFISLNGLDVRYWAPNGMQISDIAFTALTLHGWFPEFFNSVVDGGWSVGVEMSFYIIFPVLAIFIKSRKLALISLFLSLFAAYISFKYFFMYRELIWPNVAADYLRWNLINLWLPNQLPVFLIGFVLYYSLFKEIIQLSRLKSQILLIASILVMIYLAIRPNTYNVLFGIISLYSAYGLCFGFFTFTLASGHGKLFINRPIQLLGKISYSAYLWHFAILALTARYAPEYIDPVRQSWGGGFASFMIYFLAIMILTCFFSAITYHFIEKTMIRLGNNFITRASTY